MKKLISISILSFFLFFSCKKYEEGPYLSLYSKEHRVVGEWDIEYLGINGYDSTDYFRNSQTFGYYSCSKYKDGRKYIFHSYLNGQIVDGFWEMSDDKTRIINVGAMNTNITPIGAIATGKEVIWYIKRLTEKEMWLETTFENRTFYVKYKQK